MTLRVRQEGERRLQTLGDARLERLRERRRGERRAEHRGAELVGYEQCLQMNGDDSLITCGACVRSGASIRANIERDAVRENAKSIQLSRHRNTKRDFHTIVVFGTDMTLTT